MKDVYVYGMRGKKASGRSQPLFLTLWTALGDVIRSLPVVCLERFSAPGVSLAAGISPALGGTLRRHGRAGSQGSLLRGEGLSSHDSASGFPKSLKSREKLSEYLTVVIFTASAQHAAVNFGQVGCTRATPSLGGNSFRSPPSTASWRSQARFFLLLPLQALSFLPGYRLTLGSLWAWNQCLQAPVPQVQLRAPSTRKEGSAVGLLQED